MIYISGPWFVAKDGKGWPRVIETQHEDQIAILSSTLALHKCLQGTAKLIAAAPDLLEACETLMAFIVNCEPCSEEAINRAEVAIKKAEGEM